MPTDMLLNHYLSLSTHETIVLDMHGFSVMSNAIGLERRVYYYSPDSDSCKKVSREYISGEAMRASSSWKIAIKVLELFGTVDEQLGRFL